MGLGKQTALALAKQARPVLLHGRIQQRLETTREKFRCDGKPDHYAIVSGGEMRAM